MPTSRNDIVKKLEIFSGFFYIAVVGYKVNSSDDDSETVKWLETLSIFMLTTAAVLNNDFNISCVRARMYDACKELDDQRLNELQSFEFKKLDAKVSLGLTLQKVLLGCNLNSNLINLTLVLLAGASITGVWTENPLLSYLSAGVAFASQSTFSFFQLYKLPNLTDSAFDEYRNEVRRIDML